MNNALWNKCQTSGYHFIDNNNITTEKLWKDGFYLANSGKGIIIKNFVQSLNSSHFFNKTTKSSDSVLVSERENISDKSNKSLSPVLRNCESKSESGCSNKSNFTDTKVELQEIK